MIFLIYAIPGTHRRYLKIVKPGENPREINKKVLAWLGPSWGLAHASNDDDNGLLYEAQEPFYGEFKEL